MGAWLKRMGGKSDPGSMASRLPFSRRLAVGADPEEFHSMRNLGEPVPAGQLILEFVQEAVVELDDAGAAGAHEVMVVGIAFFGRQFEAGGSIAKIVAPHQAHAFQGVHVPVDGGEVAIVLAEGRMDLAIGQRTRMTSEDVQDCFALPRDLPASGTKPVGEFGEGLLDQPMGMGVLGAGVVHGDGWVVVGARRKWRVARERMKRNPSVSVIVGPVGRFRG